MLLYVHSCWTHVTLVPQVDRSEIPVPVWWVHPLRAARVLALWHQAGPARLHVSSISAPFPCLRPTPSPEERGPSAFLSFTWAGTSTLATSWWCLALFIPINFCVYFPIQLCSILMFAFQYQSDPSGNYGGWKATCIGNNWNAAVSMLKQEYKVGLVHKIMRRAWMVNTICLYSLVYVELQDQ